MTEGPRERSEHGPGESRAETEGPRERSEHGPGESRAETPVEVLMYSTNWCGYCQRARNLLERKGVAVREIKLDDEPDQRTVMLQRTGGQRTVPQIFVGELHVGGYDELAALDRSGELNKLLGLAP
jgi:glutaredoxin 3